jgi:hypothetical protein
VNLTDEEKEIVCAIFEEHRQSLTSFLGRIISPESKEELDMIVGSIEKEVQNRLNREDISFPVTIDFGGNVDISMRFSQ